MMRARRAIDFHSLRSKMLLWAVVFVAPILIILFVSTQLATRSFERQVQVHIQQILKPFVTEIDTTLLSAMRYIANKNVDLTLMDKPDEQNELAYLEAMRALGNGISEDLSVHSQIDVVFLFNGESLWFVQNYNRAYTQSRAVANEMEAYLKSRAGERSIFQQGYQSIEVNGENTFFIALDVPGGVIGCWFRASSLLEQIQGASLSGLELVMFSSPEGRMLNPRFDTRSTRTLSEMLAPYFVTSQRLASAPFSLTALWERNIVFAPFIELNNALYVSLLAACVLFAVYVLSLRSTVIKPLGRLVEAINRIKGGSFTPIPVRAGEATEIQEVYYALNAMTNEVEALKIRVYEEKLTKQNTQMQLFQLQLRPHFFLNALNNIISFARASDYVMVQRMTMCLATHCRYILYSTWYVSVEEELVYTQSYIDMQGMQYDTQYRYDCQVDDELLDREVPILSVQVFVENSLKYSRKLSRDIEIQVAITEYQRLDQTMMRIAIDDTGSGFDPDILAILNDEQLPSYTGQDQGIGISNVRQRLSILYGRDATVCFSNNAKGGAHVEVHMPTNKPDGRGQP